MRLEKIMVELPTKDFMKETATLYVQPKLSQRTATSLYMLRESGGGGGGLKILL